MSNLPKISIIIPVYNVAEYIAECIQSVMRQTYKGAIECILVDDCSPDDSIAIAERLIKEYSGSISFRILHHDRNRGLSAARNTGLDASTGDYVYFLDSDDYITDDCIALLSAPLQESDHDMIIGNYQTTDTPPKRFDYFNKSGNVVGSENIFHEYSNRSIPVIACNKLCSAVFLKKYGIFFKEGQLHEDEMWTYKTMCHMQSCFIVTACTYIYRMRDCSITNTHNSENLRKKANAYFVTLSYIFDHRYDLNKIDYNDVKKYYVYLYLSMVCGTTGNFCEEYKYIRLHYNGGKDKNKSFKHKGTSNN